MLKEELQVDIPEQEYGNFSTLEEIADFYINLYTSRTIVVVIFGQIVNDVWQELKGAVTKSKRSF